ncbi:hypothetical protein NIES267_24170 [Calothrix parasitica NIES-267]|uniref:Uncharacterized protein n=1 Tax=Calothrix parasitica NIES-267 TaxID=1973488 RepID=A0A1Z4LNY6_9CYAN|nr:hypothetical protein NIES267_24170 [Calothrix parasitica NIES-267]
MSLSISQVTVSEIPALHQVLVECGLDLRKVWGVGFRPQNFPRHKQGSIFVIGFHLTH